MKAAALTVIILACTAILLPGCSKHAFRTEGAPSALMESRAQSATQDTTSSIRSDRMLVWRAYLTLEVSSVSESMSKAIAIAEQFGGYMENKSDRGERSASVLLRIPTATFKGAVAALESLGDVRYRSIAAEDVTEQYVDVDARLKNKIELRNRLRELLQKATDVKDIVAIETELNRVQSDIDSMEGRIRVLKGQVDYATVELTLERKKILGPLGYLLKGLWWGVEKLFVVRN